MTAKAIARTTRAPEKLSAPDQLIMQTDTGTFSILRDIVHALTDKGLKTEFDQLQTIYEGTPFGAVKRACGPDQGLWRYLVVLHRQNRLRGQMLDHYLKQKGERIRGAS